MADNDDEIRIPVEIDANADSLRQVEQQAQKTEQAVDRVAAAAKRFKAAGGISASQVGFDADLQAMQEAGAGGKSSTASTSTTASAQRRLLREQRLDQQATRLQQQEDLRQQQLALSTVKLADAQRKQAEKLARDAASPTTFMQQLAGTMSRGVNAYSLMALAQGNATPAVMGFSQALLQTLTGPASNRRSTVGTVVGQAVAQQRMATAAARAAPAATAAADATAVEGAASGATSAVAPAAEAAASGGLMGALGGAASSVGAFLTNPFVLAAGAIGAGGLYYNTKETEATQAQNQLESSVGGTRNPQALLDQVYGVGHHFFVAPEQALGTATQLGTLGIKAPDLNSALQNTLAMQTLSPSQKADMAPLVGQMAAAGQSQEDIAKTFAIMEEQTRLTNIPLTKLIDNLKALELTVGATGLTKAGVTGSTALQQLFGGSLTASQVMGPMQGATGAGAFGMAAILGMTPDQFMKAQKDQPALYSALSKTLRSQTAGYSGAGKTLAAETFLQGTGLVDTSKMSPTQLQQFVSDLLGGGPDMVARLQADLGKREKAVSGGVFRGAVSGLAGDMTTIADKGKLEAQYKLRETANMAAGNMPQVGDQLSAPLPPGATPTGNGGYKRNGVYYKPDGTPVGHQGRGATLEGGPASTHWVGNVPYQPATETTAQKQLEATRILAQNVGQVGARLAANVAAGVPGSGVGDPTGSSTDPGQQRYHQQLYDTSQKYYVPDNAGHMQQVPPEQMPFFRKAAQITGIPLNVLLAQAEQESDFGRNKDTNTTGGEGQFGSNEVALYKSDPSSPYNDPNSPYYHRQWDPRDRGQSIGAMAWLDTYKANTQHPEDKHGSAKYIRDALVGYNGGGTPGYADQVLNKAAHEQVVNVQVKVTGTITDANGRPVANVAGVGGTIVSLATPRKPIGQRPGTPQKPAPKHPPVRGHRG